MKWVIDGIVHVSGPPVSHENIQKQPCQFT